MARTMPHGCLVHVLHSSSQAVHLWPPTGVKALPCDKITTHTNMHAQQVLQQCAPPQINHSGPATTNPKSPGGSATLCILCTQIPVPRAPHHQNQPCAALPQTDEGKPNPSSTYQQPHQPQPRTENKQKSITGALQTPGSNPTNTHTHTRLYTGSSLPWQRMLYR